MSLLPFAPAILFLAYSYSLYVLNWFDGRRRSGLPLVSTIFAFMAVWMGSNNWRLLVVIAVLDIGSFFVVRPWKLRPGGDDAGGANAGTREASEEKGAEKEVT